MKRRQQMMVAAIDLAQAVRYRLVSEGEYSSRRGGVQVRDAALGHADSVVVHLDRATKTPHGRLLGLL